MRAAIFTISDLPTGTLSVMARPRGGDWLADEMQALCDAGVDALISLLTANENAELDLLDEPALCVAMGMAYLALPIPDRAVPHDEAQTHAFIAQLADLLAAGQHVAIHCRQGIGRSALIAASVLVLGGVNADDAFTRIAAARGRPVPDTPEQREWVEAFAQRQRR